MRRARPLPVASAYAPWPETVLFEVSWEACNQVGGIYQVLRSKVAAMLERWGERYLLVGPYLPSQAEVESDPEEPGDWVKDLLAELAAGGLRAHHARWLVPGRPRVLLLEHRLEPQRLDALRGRFRRECGIEPRLGDALLDDVLGFGEAVRRVVGTSHRLLSSASRRSSTPLLLAHYHEWLGGAALPLVRRDGIRVPSIFTTHATSVGRFVASGQSDLYDRLSTLDGEAEATRFAIGPQHGIERLCATEADVFTTVSPITGEECARLLSRSPDLITPNGLNVDRFDVGHDFQTLHAEYKEQIHRFVMGHFFPYYSFDLDRTLYLFNAGRFEPRNKGFDLCLETMARLNAELRSSGSDMTVVFFIVTARDTQSLDPRVLRARGVLDDMNEVAHRIGEQAAERFFRRSAAGEHPRLDELVDDAWWLRQRRILHAFRAEGLPPTTTHVLRDPGGDPVLAHLRHLGLANGPEDRVKVVYHPEFISSVNPLWGVDYEQFVRGCHLGVFPSSYEPWGYTPLECVAMGVPAITSDLAGFGRYVSDVFPDHDDWGLTVLQRRGRSFHEAAADLTRYLLVFCELDRHARIAVRNAVEAHSRAFDWSRLASAYHEAHDMALGNAV